jgi:hypothetical protein
VTINYGKLFSRAVDPDPDTAFQVNQDPDRYPDPIRIHGFDDEKTEDKNTAENFFIIFFLSNRLLMSKIQ